MKRINATHAQKINTLRKCRYFKKVNEEILAEMSAGMQLFEIEEDEVVFWEGDLIKGLYIIQSGSVKLFKLSQQGRELVVTVLGKGESFGEVPVFDGGENPINAAALEDSFIWIVSTEAIQASLNKYPQVACSVILNLSKNLRMLVDKVEELSFYQVTTRLARLLDDLSMDELQGDSQDRLTREELAARLGTVREVVIRSLKELERGGAIRVYHRKIKIVDRERLREWAQTPDC